MLTLVYSDFFYLLPYLWFFFLNWIFFFKINFFNLKVFSLKKDKLKKRSVLKSIHYSIFLRWNISNNFIFLIIVFLQKGFSGVFFFNHLYLNNSLLYVVFLIFLFNIFFSYIVLQHGFNKINYNVDYFFALSNLNNFFPLIFFSNTLFTFFFLLEVNSTIIFYKFIVSKFWFKNNSNYFDINIDKFKKQVPKNYLNVLFFQYWTTFFSSTFFIFFLINLIYWFGSSEFFFINFFENFFKERFLSFNIVYKYLLFFVFLFSFFLKIGFTPLQLFKIEVYKGLPMISIFFYTTFYFFVYFTYFSLFIFVYLFNFLNYFFFFILFVIILGGFYILSLLFDLNFIKAFFAYSTLINSILFFSLLFSGFSL